MKQQVMTLRPPIQPMAARSALALPDAAHADRFAFEPKFDGFRCLAFRTGGKVQLQSRQQRPLTRYFPEVVAGLLEQVADGAVLDGELVVHHEGRLDFTALQRRIHPSAAHAARRGVLVPATLVVFDLLAAAWKDLRGEPYRTRRHRLEQLLAAVTAPLAVMPMTEDLAGAKVWMTQHSTAGIEGVVIKDLGHGYRPGRRSWSKVRTRATADAIVGGVLGQLTAPEALVLGLPDPHGRLRVAGRTAPLPLAARRELGAILSPPVGRHPWPATIPSSRFGQVPPELVTYTPTEPLVVVEVDADMCFEQHRWRHATIYRRVRREMDPSDLGWS